jgi:hypothetical protein
MTITQVSSYKPALGLTRLGSMNTIMSLGFHFGDYFFKLNAGFDQGLNLSQSAVERCGRGESNRSKQCDKRPEGPGKSENARDLKGASLRA